MAYYWPNRENPGAPGMPTRAPVAQPPPIAARKGRTLPGAPRIRNKELPIFTRMLAAMLDSGIPLVQALAAMEEQTSNKVFSKVILGLRNRIEAGMDFSAALAEYPSIFDELYVSMMRAGEAGGILAEIAARLAKHLETAIRLRRKIRSAMAYPAVVLTLAISIATAMIIWLIPVFKDIYEDFEGRLPGPTLLLIQLSNLLRNYFLIVLGAVILLAVLFVKWKKSESGRRMWDGFVLRLPLIGELAKKICLARFASTFAQLIHSGVPILESLLIVSVAVGNRVIGNILLRARQSVEGGDMLSAELQKHRVFPRMLVYMLAAGEKTGKMDEMLQKVAEFYEDEVESALAGLTSIIEPILMVFLGVVVGFVVLGMFMPIFRMTDILNF